MCIKQVNFLKPTMCAVSMFVEISLTVDNQRRRPITPGNSDIRFCGIGYPPRIS